MTFGNFVTSGIRINELSDNVLVDIKNKDVEKAVNNLYQKIKSPLKVQIINAYSTPQGNQKLRNAIDQIYRPGATTGDGSLADAIRHQLSTGELVGGKDHLIKGAERVKNLENIIKKETLSNSDSQLAQRLLNDLKNALGGN